MEKTFYESVGRCIYCGATEYDPADPGSPLHEEHIIPFSLNGDLVLPEASCRSCEKETHRYEGVVARTIFGNLRMRHNLWTRRPKDRPKFIEIGTRTADGTTGTARVPLQKFATSTVTYKFDKARILLEKNPDNVQFKWLPVILASDKDLQAMTAEYGWDGRIQSKMVPIELARTIAKIGYSYAIALLRPETFIPHPHTIDIILNRTDDVSYTVGGSMEILPHAAHAGHTVQVGCLGIAPHVHVIAMVRLFANQQSPHYHVVVGSLDFQNPQHVRSLFQRMENSEAIEFPLPWP